jgi:hypothetical protein
LSEIALGNQKYWQSNLAVPNNLMEVLMEVLRMNITRAIMLCFSLIFIGLMLAGQSYAQVNMKSAVAMWLFDEGQGNEIKDATGNGNDGTFEKGVEWVNGKYGKALKFDGQTGTVEINTPVNLTDPDLTIMLWVNPGATQAKGWCDILSNHGEPPGAGYCIEQNGSEANKFYFDFNADGTWQSGWNIAGAPLTQLKADTWQHFAVVRKANVVTHYLNGEKTESKDNVSKSAVTASPKNLRLSNFGWRTIERQFNGIMDDLAIFNVALDVNDIKSIMNKGIVLSTAVSSSEKLIATWSSIKVQH